MIYQKHELNLYPEIQDEEYQSLKTSIQIEYDKTFPVVIYDDKILDGWNRYRVCNELNIQPVFEYFKGTRQEALEFVIRSNERRDLTKGQRACLALEYKPLLIPAAKERQKSTLPKKGQKGFNVVPETEPHKGKSSDQAGDKFKVGKQSIYDVEKIKQQSPEIYKQIKIGDKNINEAKKEINKQNRKQKQADQEKQAIEKLPEKLDWSITDNQDVVECNAIVTDPPYGILDEMWEPSDLEKFTKEWSVKWNNSKADLMAIFFSQRYLFEGRKWFDESFTNYDFQQLLIWHYPNNKKPQSRMMFKQTWEPIFLYRLKDSKKEIKLKGTEWGNELNDFDCHISAIPQTNYNDAEQKVHPAQKSVSVIKWLINCISDIGDLIVDPFMGSGTTGIASIQLNRKFHGIEIDKETIEIARKRIACYGYKE